MVFSHLMRHSLHRQCPSAFRTAAAPLRHHIKLPLRVKDTSIRSVGSVPVMAEDLVTLAKKKARSDIKASLKQMTADDMLLQSQAICGHVVNSAFFTAAKDVGVYIHCARLMEVDTTVILEESLQQGKKCFVPLVKDKASNMQLLHLDDMSALHPAPPYGILEPSTTYTDGRQRQDALDSAHGQALDLLLMPGLGFDRNGHRLGRGGGYYDKAVNRLKTLAEDAQRQRPLLVALAFGAQVIDSIPMGPHDEKIDILVTATGCHACTNLGRQALAT